MQSTYSGSSSGSRRDSQLGPWVEGVAYNKAAEDIEEAGVTTMSNMELDTSGELKKRLGTASYEDESPISGNPTVTFCGEFTIPPDTTEVVMIAGARAYRHSGSAWADQTDGTITAGDDNTFVGAVDEGNGVLLLTNGVNPPLSKTTTGVFAVADVESQFTAAGTVAHFDNRAWWGSTTTSGTVQYDRLWYSDLADNTCIPLKNNIYFGHPITALVPMRESLAVHTENGIFTVTPTGNSEAPFQKEQVTTRGCVSKRGVAVLPGEVQQFVRRDGIYSWDGGDSVEKISHALDGGYWPKIDASRMKHSFVLYYPLKDQTWFWLPYSETSGTQTEMNHIMVWSGVHETFFGPYEGGSLFTRNCAGLIGGSPHAGTHDSSGSIGGTVQDHQPAATYNDDDNVNGAAIRAYFKTGSPAPEGSANMVRWLYARTYYDATGAFTVTVEQESSGVDGTTKTFTVDGGGFTLGSSNLDEEELGTVRMLSVDTDLTGYDPHSSLKFSNNDVDAFFTIRRTHPVYLEIGHIRRRKAGVA